MKYIEILHQQLKSDVVIDLLELLDANVEYDFDRLREGTEDSYTVSCPEHGIELQFDANQTLQTIFLRVGERDGRSAIDLSESDIEVFESRSDVEAYAKTMGWPTVSGGATLAGIETRWIRIDCDTYSAHYEFRDNLLHMITIMGSPT